MNTRSLLVTATPCRGATPLVIPRLHVASIFDLAPQAQAAMWYLAAQVRYTGASRKHSAILEGDLACRKTSP
jgi:hypothetical protein